MQKKATTKRQPIGQLIDFPGGTSAPPRVDESAPEEEAEIKSFDDLFEASPVNTMLLTVDGHDSELGICEGDRLVVKNNRMAGIRDAVIVEGEDGGNVVTSFREIDGRHVVGVVTYLIRSMRNH